MEIYAAVEHKNVFFYSSDKMPHISVSVDHHQALNDK
jgi:hypothetical protein